MQWDLVYGDFKKWGLGPVYLNDSFPNDSFPDMCFQFELIQLCGRVNPFPNKSRFFHVDLKHWGKRRNCFYQAISPFSEVFTTLLENSPPFSSNLKLSSANSFSFEELLFGKGIKTLERKKGILITDCCCLKMLWILES